MSGNLILAIAAFGSVSSLIALLFVVTGSRNPQIDTRLAEVAQPAAERKPALSAGIGFLSDLGAKIMPDQEGKLERARTRLLQGGFYRNYASATFFALRFLLLVLPILVGVVLAAVEILPVNEGIIYGIVVGLAGTALPGMLISRRHASRQKQIRRALPDTLDVIVICLEGGLSLPASFIRVTEELGTAYPLLTSELNIVRKQIELGHSTADAFREFADRIGLDELRSLALLIAQSEKYGASLVRTLRIQADGLRLKRYQWAEGQAQKAPLKLIFPTVVCIFPALYIVLMGPALVQLQDLLHAMGS